MSQLGQVTDRMMTEATITPTTQSSDNFATQVLGQLKQDILTGYFKPGAKLKMARLKERYQVGVSPLREALSQLLVEQLVIVENQRGFTVHPISAEEMKDIYHTRAQIEGLCVSQAVELGDDAWEAGILAAAHQLKKSAALLDEKQPGRYPALGSDPSGVPYRHRFRLCLPHPAARAPLAVRESVPLP